MTKTHSSLRKAVAAIVLVFAVLLSGSVKADKLIEIDVNGVAPQYRGVFSSAAATMNSMYKGWNPDMPKIFRATLDPILITAITPFIDGAGGILGSAGPTSTKVWNDNAGVFDPFNPQKSKRWEVSQLAGMQFDIADLATLAADGDLEDVVLHEMFHALGFGTLWIGNEAALDNNMDGIADEYVGEWGIAGHQEDGGFGSPPIEQLGGAGTAGGHWDRDTMNDTNVLNQINTSGRRDIMLGSLYVLNNQGDFVKGQIDIFNTTEQSLYDVGLWHSDSGDFTDGAFGGPNKWYGGVFPWSPTYMRRGDGSSSVPEPSGVIVLLIGMAGIACRRKRA